MKFGWKVLIPASLAWIFIVAIARVFRNDFSFSNQQLLIAGAIVIAVLLVGSWLLQSAPTASKQKLMRNWKSRRGNI